METTFIPEEIKDVYKHAINEARKDRPRYFDWIKNEINVAIDLINKFDKTYVLGGLGSKLIESVPNLHNQFMETYDGSDKDGIEDEKIKYDDEIEVLLEYALSIAMSSANESDIIPTQDDIDFIYNQLSKIKANINFWELSSDIPANGNEFDHWLRTNIMQDSINVRGNGYHVHIEEVYKEVFQAHDGFLEQYYGFSSKDIYNVMMKLDSLVYSKIGNPYGSMQAHRRFTEWMDLTNEDEVMQVMIETGKHFIQQFTEANPDLYDESVPDKIFAHPLNNISGYNKIFWVIPKTEKEEKIFNQLSVNYGENTVFLQPDKFKAFPLNDSLIKSKPLVKDNERFYHFSTNLPFRNIFKITEELLKSADHIYYNNYFMGNSEATTKDNYVELKTKLLFEKLLPNANFYHSLDYSILDKGELKKTELDVLGLSEDSVYIIEVKSGELNTKHRRGAVKGLKDRLNETINAGSFQCHRALNYIQESDEPIFEYIENATRNSLKINKEQITNYYKISVTFEHFASVSTNLKYLVDSNILCEDYKWTWIVSLYDLMIFSELIESENDFKEYLEYRIGLYDRNDIEFSDEIDILGFFMDGNFPLEMEAEEAKLYINNCKNRIDTYYTRKGVGMPGIIKPKRKNQ